MRLLYQTITVYNITTKSSKTHHDNFSNDNRKLLIYQNKVYLTDFSITQEISFKNDIEVQIVPFKKENLYHYSQTITDFIRQLKQEKPKYTLLKKLEYCNLEVFHDYKNLRLNNLVLTNDTFNKVNYSKLSNESTIEPLVNLYLKKIRNKVEVIKAIKNVLNISLQEAHEITNKNLSLIAGNLTPEMAENYKTEIEKSGAVCYVQIALLKSNDGSTITCNNGVLEFVSSNEVIPKFYIPFITNMATAMATNTEFAGNNYFLPSESELKIITVEGFHQKYIEPFIEQLI